MAGSRAWDDSIPPGTQGLSVGDDRIREFREDTRERLALEHFWKVNTTVDGKHRKTAGRTDFGTNAQRLAIVLDTSTEHSDQGRLFFETVSGKWFYVGGDDTWVDLGFRKGRRVLFFVVRNALVSGPTKLHAYVPVAGTWVRIRGTVDVAPVGRTIEINVRLGATVGGEATIFGAGRRLVIPEGATKVGAITIDSGLGDNPVINADNFVTIDVDFVGTTTAGVDLVVGCEFDE